MNEHEHQHEPLPYKVYFIVWGLLLFLTAVTVGISYLDLKQMTVAAAMIIATVKGSLVLLYFMHARYEKPYLLVMFLGVAVTYATFIALTFSDYIYR